MTIRRKGSVRRHPQQVEGDSRDNLDLDALRRNWLLVPQEYPSLLDSLAEYLVPIANLGKNLALLFTNELLRMRRQLLSSDRKCR